MAKIIHEREKCVGCGFCASICPEHWEMSDDGKSTLKGSKKVNDHYEKEVEEYYKIMTERKFLPNTPTIANFGSFLGMGSACFVLDIEDSIESIMDTLKKAAIIFKSGGGVGYNFSKLRPEGDFVLLEINYFSISFFNFFYHSMTTHILIRYTIFNNFFA